MPVQAIGKIARFQIVCSFIHLSTLPLAAALIVTGVGVNSVLYASLLTVILNTFVRGYLLSRITSFSYLRWIREVVLIGGVVIAPSLFIAVAIIFWFPESLERLIVTVISLSFLTLVMMYFVGMDNHERLRILMVLKAFKYRRL